MSFARVASGVMAAVLAFLPTQASAQETLADVSPRTETAQGAAGAALAGAAGAPILVRGTEGMTLHAVALTQPLTIDGRLDEPLYRDHAPASGFEQVEPRAGEPATEVTELWIAFDRDRIYVSFRCLESRPDRLVAQEMRRDNGSIWSGDDNVAFIFDTFNDKRNGFQFTLNSIGGRQDAQIANERQWGGDWNTVWSFKVARFEGGWTVETAIPFRSLRYRPGDNQVWGFNAFRTNRWKNELSFLKPTTKAMGQRGLLQTSMAVPLLGLVTPSGAAKFELKPYAIQNLSGARDQITGDFAQGVVRDIGGDLKYSIGQNLTADFTYNTDFAQVEADQQQVNLTRFNLFFPEKREFFLENQGVFQFGTTGQNNTIGDTPILFYSRRIGLEGSQVVPIDGGARVSGRVGRFSVGALNIQAGRASIPGTTPVDLPRTGYSVVRVRRDLLRRSSIGMLYTGRHAHTGTGSANEVYGVDGMFAFFANLGINTYWAQSRTPDTTTSNTSYRAQLDYNGDRYGVQLEQLHVGKNFTPGIGFVRRSDMTSTFGLFRFSPRPRVSERIRRYSFATALKNVVNTSGKLETRDHWSEFALEFRNGDRFSVANNYVYEYLPRPFRILGMVTLPVDSYTFDNVTVAFHRAPQQKVAGDLIVERGTFYNGDKTTFTLNAGRLAFSPRLSAEPTYAVNRVELEQASFTTHLAGTRITLTPTPLMFASALLQYNSSTKGVSANVRFRWEYILGSELFVVYNEERGTLTRPFPDINNRAFIVKINRMLRF